MHRHSVGAFGEKAVETELWRRGWLVANFNGSHPNSPEYDLFAKKGNKSILIQVKCSSPHSNKFQISGLLLASQVIAVDDSNFSIFVKMGADDDRTKDQFYIMKTNEFLPLLHQYRESYLAQAKHDGSMRKDIGHWSFYLNPLRRDPNRINYNVAELWKDHLDNWKALEK